MKDIVIIGDIEVFNKDVLKPSRAIELKVMGTSFHGLIKRVHLDLIEVLVYNDEEDKMMTIPLELKDRSRIRVLS